MDGLVDSPVYVEPFAGAASTWLHLVDPSLVALCSWMGGKRRDAPDHLALLGLRPGHPVPTVLGDASWWGWVWPVVLDQVTGPEVSTMLRFWYEQPSFDPRGLWFWLRDVGPMPSRAEAAAQLLWLQARAASGVPVWWDGETAIQYDQAESSGGRPYAARQSHANNPGHDRRTSLVQHASTQIDQAGQRQATEPGVLLAAPGDGRGRQIAADRGTNGAKLTCDHHPPGMSGDAALLMASDGRGVQREAGQKQLYGGTADGGAGAAYCKGTAHGKTGGIVDPRTVADRIDEVRAACAKGYSAAGAGGIVDPRLVIEHRDALDLTEEWAPRLGEDARVVLDWPYDACTGYPVACPREKCLVIGEMWARHGARIVACEGVPLASELGRGWTSTLLRRGKKGREEWITTYGCDVRELMPPLLRGVA